MNVGKIFLRLCSSSSPVCAILHNSRRVDDLIERMIQGNITRDQMLMKIFHEEIPVLFDVVALLEYYPCHALSPLLKVMLEKSRNPFLTSTCDDKNIESNITCDRLSFFPSLPQKRNQRQYVADMRKSDPVCTKRFSHYPSLLPGIFTIFCQHG